MNRTFSQVVSQKLNQSAGQKKSKPQAQPIPKPAAPSSSVPASAKPTGNVNKKHDLQFVIFSQWPKSQSELEDAPEIAILYKQYHSEKLETKTCLSKLLRVLGTLCKIRTNTRYGLANFKPITARSNNTLEYVRQRVIKYSKSDASAPPGKTAGKTSVAQSKYSISKGNPPQTAAPPTSSNNTLKPTPNPTGLKPKFLKEFYEVAYQTLQFLRKGIHHYKEIILTLSFTRYAEYALTGSESKLIWGKSIIGSCIWTITCALKQLQEDPAVEQFESSLADSKKPSETQNSILLDELASELLILVNLSFDTWNETIIAINILERIHLNTEEIFTKQISYFHKRAMPDSVQAISASVHLKKHIARWETNHLELVKVNPLAASRKTVGKKYGYPRVLYNNNYAQKNSQWRGFDPLSVRDKIGHLKEVMKFIQVVLESVKGTAQKIAEQLQGGSQHQNKPMSGITSYEGGIDKMKDFIDKNISNNTEWSLDETEEFFETDKIFLDDIDLVTLGAAVTRTILHDARHCIHICYEISRLLNFKEFINLPEYDKVQKVYYKTKDEAAKKRPSVIDKPAKGRSSDSYDIEEPPLDLRNLHNLFRNNPYYEVTKVLPIYCAHVGLTLQDADLVFTPSSEKLLSDRASFLQERLLP